MYLTREKCHKADKYMTFEKKVKQSSGSGDKYLLFLCGVINIRVL